MNAPNLPTDSLYKFLALSGVLIYAVSAYFPARMAFDSRIEVERLAGEVDAIEYEARRVYGAEWDQLKDAEGDSAALAAFDSTPRSDSAQAVFEAKSEERAQLRATMDRVNTERRMIQARLEEVEFWMGLGQDGRNLGMAVAALGFLLWYVRLQRYMDKIVAREANLPEPPATGRRHKFE